MKIKNISFYKRLAGGMVLSVCTLALAGTIAFNGTVGSKTEENTAAVIDTNGKAGIVASLEKSEDLALDQVLSKDIQIAKTEVEVVAAAPREEAQEAAEMSQEKAAEDTKDKIMSKTEQEWQEKVMAVVDDSLSIRAKADADSEIVGKMYPTSVATVVKQGEAWTKIESGSVKGYVKNSYLVFGSEAYEHAKNVCKKYAVVKTDGLRVRSEATENASVIATVNKGDKLLFNADEKRIHGWVAVKADAGNGYVSEDYVNVKLNITEAVSMEEIAAQKAKEEAAAKEKALKEKTSTASADDITLLAAIIQCEAGSESYKGKVAVGAVVMNRVKSSRFPNTISGVIYQRCQFTPAGNGILARCLASGNISSSCREAALEALAGADPTGGKLYFHRVNGDSGLIIGNHVFF